MTEAQTYSTNRLWALVRKASSDTDTRDWYQEWTDMINEIDQDVASALGGNVFTYNAGATGAETYANFLAAYNAAKATIPTEANPATIKCVSGLHTVPDTTSFELDTPYINLIGSGLSSCNVRGRAVTSADITLAKTVFFGSNTNAGAIYVTALNTIMTGIHCTTSGTTTGGSLVSQTAYSTTDGNIFIGCSTDAEGFAARVPNMSFYKDCNFLGNFACNATAGSIGGIVDNCTCASGGFLDGTGALQVTVSNSSFVQDTVYSTAILHQISFKDCEFYGASVYDMSSGGSVAAETVRFDRCHFGVDEIFKTATPSSAKAIFNNCTFTDLAETLNVGEYGELNNCLVNSSVTITPAVKVAASVGRIVNSRILVGDESAVPCIGSDETVFPAPLNIDGNTLTALVGSGIQTTIDYVGSNTVNGELLFKDVNTTNETALASSSNPVLNSTDKSIFGGINQALSASLQDAYDNGNTIQLADTRQFEVSKEAGLYGIVVDDVTAKLFSQYGGAGLTVNKTHNSVALQGYQIDVSTQNTGDLNITADGNLHLASNGTTRLSDSKVTTPIQLGDDTNSEFSTTNKTLVGAVNELKSSVSAIEVTKLQRVDDESWETAQIGVEYFSPNQHGNVYGKVIRKYHGVVPSPSLWFSGVAKLLDGSTNALDDFSNQSTGATGPVGASVVYLDTDSPTGDILTGAGFNIIDGWIDYTLINPPSTSPSGQPSLNSESLQQAYDIGGTIRFNNMAPAFQIKSSDASVGDYDGFYIYRYDDTDGVRATFWSTLKTFATLCENQNLFQAQKGIQFRVKSNWQSSNLLSSADIEIVNELEKIHLETVTADKPIELLSAGDISLKDKNLTTSVPLSEAGETSLSTTKQSIVGAINELQAGGSGEANTASSLGTGEALTAGKSGVDLQFKSLKAGSGVTLSATGDDVTIEASGGGGTSDSIMRTFNVFNGDQMSNTKTVASNLGMMHRTFCTNDITGNKIYFYLGNYFGGGVSSSTDRLGVAIYSDDGTTATALAMRQTDTVGNQYTNGYLVDEGEGFWSLELDSTANLTAGNQYLIGLYCDSGTGGSGSQFLCKTTFQNTTSPANSPVGGKYLDWNNTLSGSYNFPATFNLTDLQAQSKAWFLGVK